MGNRCPQITALGRSVGKGNREAWMQPQTGRVRQCLLMVRLITQHELTTAHIARCRVTSRLCAQIVNKFRHFLWVYA
jgi:hypothetical protein